MSNQRILEVYLRANPTITPEEAEAMRTAAREITSPHDFMQYLHARANPEFATGKVTVEEGRVVTPITEQIIRRQQDTLRKRYDYQFTPFSTDPCPRCKQYTIVRQSRQLSSGDEAATTVTECRSCKYRATS